MTYGLLDLAKDAALGKVETVSEDIAAKRKALCDACPHLRANIPNKALTKIDGERCNLCGCYMPVKVKLAKASCPAKKW